MDELQLVVDVFIERPTLGLLAVALFSLCIGSFLNVVIYRLPRMMETSWQQEYQQYFHPDTAISDTPRYNLAVPGSACPHCGHALAAKDNIPLLSYLWLKGKCRYCQAPVSARYPLIEAFTMALSLVVAWKLGPTPLLLVALPLTWALVALSFIDIDKMLLPDEITLPVLWGVLMAAVLGWTIAPEQALIGAAVGYLSLWSVYWLFKLLTGKEGMGYGDFKLLAIFGALLGWQALPLIILLSSVVGAIIGTIMLSRRGKGKDTPIPFGPYIALAGWIAMLWGSEITHWYLGRLAL